MQSGTPGFGTSRVIIRFDDSLDRSHELDTSLDSTGSSFGLDELKAEIVATAATTGSAQKQAGHATLSHSYGQPKGLLFPDASKPDSLFKSPTGTESSVSAIQSPSLLRSSAASGVKAVSLDMDHLDSGKILQDLSMSGDASAFGGMHSSFESSSAEGGTTPKNQRPEIHPLSPQLQPARPKSPVMTPIAIRPMPDQVISKTCFPPSLF